MLKMKCSGLSKLPRARGFSGDREQEDDQTIVVVAVED